MRFSIKKQSISALFFGNLSANNFFSERAYQVFITKHPELCVVLCSMFLRAQRFQDSLQ